MKKIILLTLLVACSDSPVEPEEPWCNVAFGFFFQAPGAGAPVIPGADRLTCEGPEAVIKTETGEHVADYYGCSWCVPD